MTVKTTFAVVEIFIKFVIVMTITNKTKRLEIMTLVINNLIANKVFQTVDLVRQTM